MKIGDRVKVISFGDTYSQHHWVFNELEFRDRINNDSSMYGIKSYRGSKWNDIPFVVFGISEKYRDIIAIRHENIELAINKAALIILPNLEINNNIRIL